MTCLPLERLVPPRASTTKPPTDHPSVDLIEVMEGSVRVLIPPNSAGDQRRIKRGRTGPRGPARIDDEGLFYNPSMRFARDLTVLVVEERAAARRARMAARIAERRAEGAEAFDPGPFLFYDGLGATGVRGVRVAVEAREEVRAIINDRNATSVALARRIVDINDVNGTVTIHNDEFGRALGGQRVDHVDVDPFGSPAPFFDAAVQSVRDRGLIGVTATDMTALCGIYPRVCRRRYDAEPWHATAMHEVAMRIIAGAMVRAAAKHEMALRPVLMHCTDHYVRVFGEARRGSSRADETLAHLGLAVEQADGVRSLVPDRADVPADAVRTAGPLWIGPLHDADLVGSLRLRLEEHDQLETAPLVAFLDRAVEEARGPALYYSMKEWGRRLRQSPPPREAFFQTLRDAGYRAARVHVPGDLFRTDAPADVIASCLGSAVSG